MPLFLQWDDAPSATKTAIWKVEEDVAYFEVLTGLAPDISYGQRRTEHLAGRHLLQLLSPDISLSSIVADEHGKPRTPDDEVYFSISHSWPFVAARVSATTEVGIDIQTFRPKIELIKHKFLSLEEQDILNNDFQYITLGWAAKEAAYKWNGKRALAFKEHIPIQKLVDQDQLELLVVNRSDQRHIKIKYFMNSEFVCAYVD